MQKFVSTVTIHNAKVSLSEVKMLVAAGVVRLVDEPSSSAAFGMKRVEWNKRFMISKDNVAFQRVRELTRNGNLYYSRSQFYYIVEKKDSLNTTKKFAATKSFNKVRGRKPILTAEQVNAVNNMFVGGMNKTEIAKKFGVSRMTIIRSIRSN